MQIFTNLLNNAIKFTPSGGKVSFIISADETNDNMINLKFIVRDNGHGMSEEFQKKMYEPFEQENRWKTSDSGTGLGLSIVNKLVNLMGGTISCHSKENVGTEFVIELTAEAVNEKTVCVEENGKRISLLNKRILLCEDHPLNTKISRKLLENRGMIVEHAENGKIAVDLFEKSPDCFYDAILMDIRMPVMNGLEAARKIRGLKRKDAKRVPIVAMTANAFEEDIRECIDAGMNVHLRKPIEPELLYLELERLISQA